MFHAMIQIFVSCRKDGLPNQRFFHRVSCYGFSCLSNVQYHKHGLFIPQCGFWL